MKKYKYIYIFIANLILTPSMSIDYQITRPP